MSKKRYLFSLIVIATITLMFSVPVVAYDAEEHNDYMEKVLFGDTNFEDSKSQNVKNKIEMLESASYLCIDQDRGEGKSELQFLKKQKVKNIPKLEEFDLVDIFYGNHRNYTHRGWDYKYVIPKGEKHDKANWQVRKKLLCSTVNKVFDFGIKNEMFGNICAQCDSFSALIYYIHILGDHLEKTSYKVSDLTIPLARAHADDNNPDVFSEIRKHSIILFESQKKSISYSSYILELDCIALDARALASSIGGIDDTNFEEYHSCAEKLMDTLVSYVPLLLKKETFFKNEFYK